MTRDDVAAGGFSPLRIPLRTGVGRGWSLRCDGGKGVAVEESTSWLQGVADGERGGKRGRKGRRRKGRRKEKNGREEESVGEENKEE